MRLGRTPCPASRTAPCRLLRNRPFSFLYNFWSLKSPERGNNQKRIARGRSGVRGEGVSFTDRKWFSRLCSSSFLAYPPKALTTVLSCSWISTGCFTGGSGSPDGYFTACAQVVEAQDGHKTLTTPENVYFCWRVHKTVFVGVSINSCCGRVLL